MQERVSQVYFKVERGSLAKATNITGHVWLQVGENGFPDQHWNDFPVIILGCWLDGLTGLFLGSETSCECLFMDGPYEFTVTRANDKWLIYCFDMHTTPATAEIEVLVDPESFMRSLLTTSGEVIAECGKRQWQTTDINYLTAKWTHLTALLNEGKT